MSVGIASECQIDDVVLETKTVFGDNNRLRSDCVVSSVLWYHGGRSSAIPIHIRISDILPLCTGRALDVSDRLIDADADREITLIHSI